MSQWAKRAAWGTLMMLVGAWPGLTPAAEMDGATPFLCAVIAVTECDRWGACEPVELASAGFPPFVRVDVGRKALEATDGSGRHTDIHSSTLVTEKGRLLLQGGENGRGWSVVIGQRAGEMTGAIVDHDGGFLLSGACTLP